MKIDTNETKKYTKKNFITKILNISEFLGDRLLYYYNNKNEIITTVTNFLIYLKITIFFFISSKINKSKKKVGNNIINKPNINNTLYSLDECNKYMFKSQMVSALKVLNFKVFKKSFTNYMKLIFKERGIKSEIILRRIIGIMLILFIILFVLCILYIIFDKIVTFFMLGVGLVHGIILFGLIVLTICGIIILVVSSR